MAEPSASPTEFDKHGPPAMRLYLRLLKIRRNPSVSVEITNVKLMQLTGLKDKTFRRARQNLADWGLISFEPLDAMATNYRYVIEQPDNPAWKIARPVVPRIGLALTPDVSVVPISHESLFAALSPAPSLKGKTG